MGRHVVIAFDDNNDAEQFVAAVKVEGAVFVMGTDGHFNNINVDTTEVLGMFGKPSKFCECDYKEDDKFTRGETYGWYVHTACKRPRGGQLQTAPKNLLLPKGMGAREIVGMEKYVGLSAREGKVRWPEPKGR